MDIVLQRIISLIPKKENGDFVHGEKKKFAQSIGYKGGEIIAEWIAGRSTTYMSKIYEISEKYNVDVDWLLGKQEKPSENGKPTSEYDAVFGEIWETFTEDQKKATIEFMKMFKR